MKEYKILEFLKYKFFSEKFFQVKGDHPKKLPLPQMWKYKKTKNQWSAQAMGPNFFLFDRAHLSEENRAGKSLYLFLSQRNTNFNEFFWKNTLKNIQTEKY